MKKKLLSIAVSLLAFASCSDKDATTSTEWIDHALDVATYQLNETGKKVIETNLIPRSTRTDYDPQLIYDQVEIAKEDYTRKIAPKKRDGGLDLVKIIDWTSGYFAGSMWYCYELTGDEEVKENAIHYTKILNPLREFNKTHDIGLMVNCSFGNALRLAPNDSVKMVIVETADNLYSRYDPTIKSIRSWDFGEWNFPVIIDNMMNLDLLFTASKISGDKKYYDVAVNHALTTMKYHFRPDYTCYHVISYNDDGSVESRGTHQGKNDDSSWSRGQAWAVYGYAACFRETKMDEFLEQATHVADMIMKLNVAPDKIPYWDFDAPINEKTPRDASAGAIIASAMLELSTLVDDGSKYFDYAEQILKTLSSDEYLAKKGENNGFILMHSVGSLPSGIEIDSPLNYADYYYLEALKRYTDIKK